MKKIDIQHFLHYADDFEFKGFKYKILPLYQWEAMMKDYKK